MSGRDINRIAVLMGGPSSESEVSRVTGQQCALCLRQEGYDVIEVEAGEDFTQRLADVAPDVVFNALHGRWGEDGCVQGILEWLQIPYTHSGVAASSLAMNKLLTKTLAYAVANLPTADSVLIPQQGLNGRHPLRKPYIVKPVAEGSSVGVSVIGDGDAPPDVTSGGKYGQMMAEVYVPGRELTVTVFEDQPLTVTEIIAPDWYDYDAKYQPGGSQHVVPADISADISDMCMRYALQAHQVLWCRGISRTDFRWNDELGIAGIRLLETNTQPGMTPTSLSPEQGEYCGISFARMCRSLVEDASCRK